MHEEKQPLSCLMLIYALLELYNQQQNSILK